MDKLTFEELEGKVITIDYKGKNVIIESWYEDEMIGKIAFPIEHLIKHFAIPLADIKHCYTLDSFFFTQAFRNRKKSTKVKEFTKKYNVKLFRFRRDKEIVKRKCASPDCDVYFEATGKKKHNKYCSRECSINNLKDGNDSGENALKASATKQAKKGLKKILKEAQKRRRAGLPNAEKFKYTCLHCEKEFETTKENAKYCSTICYGKRKRVREYTEIICLNCGKIFETKRLQQKFCCFDCYAAYKPIGSKD